MGLGLLIINLINPRETNDLNAAEEGGGLLVNLGKVAYLFGLVWWAVNGWRCHSLRRPGTRSLLSAMAVFTLLVAFSVPFGTPGGLWIRWLLYSGCAVAAVIGAGAPGQFVPIRNLLVITAAASLFAFAVAPSWAAQWGYAGYLPFRLVGVSNHANSIAPMMLLGLVMLILSPYRSWLSNIASLGLFLSVLIMAQSKTTLICLIIVMFGWILQVLLEKGGRNGLLLIGLAILVMTAAAVAMLLAGGDQNGPLGLLGTGDVGGDFTGRTTIWEYTLKRWEENRWFGVGIGRLWDEPMREDFRAWTGWTFAPGYAHSLFYQVLGESGWFGIAGLSAFLLSCLHLACTSRWPWLLIPTFATLLGLRGMTEVSWWFSPYTENLMLVYMLLAVGLNSKTSPSSSRSEVR